MVDFIERGDKVQMRMPAVLEDIDEVDDHVVAYLTTKRVPVDIFAVRILLREALMNAVTHGSGKDFGKSIYAELEIDSEGLTLLVRDSGRGFDWQAYTGQLDVLDGDGGRGVALLGVYSDKVTYNDKGNEVVLRRNFEASAKVSQ